MDLSRRQLLFVGAAAGGGFLVGWHRPSGPRILAAAAKAAPAVFAPNAFIRIGRDGRITLIMNQVEMGQGTYTSMPMLLAEELEVGLDQLHLEHAPPDDKLYSVPVFGFQVTGASCSVRLLYEPLRRAGAAARSMLVAAAAQTWSVDAASCRAEKGVVTHTPTGRTLRYGALADKAATLPVPAQVVLKDPREFKLIGTPAKRLDTPAKVNGTAQFGIDVRLPGMNIATVAASPVVGGKLAFVDDSEAKAIPGVRQIVRLDDAVAVVADNMWAAKRGLKALTLRWEDGPNGTIATADVVRGLAAAAETPGVVARNEGDAPGVIAGASRKIESVYEAPFLAHAALEPINCTVHVRPDRCEVWTGSQVLSRVQAAAAKVTGLPLEKVVVHNFYLGGAFGRRLEVDYVPQAVRIGQQVQGPVKVIWTREEDIRHDVVRPYYYDRIAAAVDARGMPTAWTPRRHERHRPGCRRRSGGSALRHPGDSGRVRAPRGASSQHRVLARSGSDAQHLRDRKLHRRAGRGRETGSGRLSARAARQVCAGQGGPGRRRARGRLGPAAAARTRPRCVRSLQLLGQLSGSGRRGLGIRSEIGRH